MKAEGIVPMDPKDEETLRKKQANPYTTMSQRAVAVPRVGVHRGPERKPLVDCLPRRRAEEDIRANEGGFERPRAPAGKLGMSSDARKDELALKNQFFGKTPQQVLAEHPRPARHGDRAPAPQKPDEHQLAAAIADEIHERQQFLDEMTSLGQGHVHQRIESEMQSGCELKTLEPYLQQVVTTAPRPRAVSSMVWTAGCASIRDAKISACKDSNQRKPLSPLRFGECRSTGAGRGPWNKRSHSRPRFASPPRANHSDPRRRSPSRALRRTGAADGAAGPKAPPRFCSRLERRDVGLR